MAFRNYLWHADTPFITLGPAAGARDAVGSDIVLRVTMIGNFHMEAISGHQLDKSDTCNQVSGYPDRALSLIRTTHSYRRPISGLVSRLKS